jgi:hypothetical protein
MIRIGIIGTDASAHLHTTVLLTNTAYEIVGCFAPENRDSMLFAREYRLVSYSSLEALFKYSDAIDIAANISNLMQIAEKSLKALKHVFIAYPHYLRLDEMQHLTNLADESGVILQMGTKYNHCAIFDAIAGLKKIPLRVAINHQLKRTDEDFCASLSAELSYDLAFILGIFDANIMKIDLTPRSKTHYSDVLQCNLDCDNGSIIHLTIQTTVEGEAKLEVTLNYHDMDIKADVFKSEIEKRYHEYDVIDSTLLDAYNEKEIRKQDMVNFGKAIAGDQDVISQIERQAQCFAATDLIIECFRKNQTIAIS